MNAPTPSSSERTAKLEGLGCASKRVEDARFTQGKGNYVDDIKLPGMLFGDFVRSPYGHARITRIDKEAALKVPGVVAILTAADLKPLNLHYMPTLAGDVQAVLADEKVLFQAQEVAFVDRDRPLCRGRCGRARRGRLRGAAGAGRPIQGAGCGCAGAARRHQGQDRQARTARAATRTMSSSGKRATRRRPSRRSPRPRSWPRS